MGRFAPIRTAAPLFALACLGACGGSDSSSPGSPGPVATPAPRALTAGTTLSVVSGEDYGPVEGARVILHGREYTADATGHVVLVEEVPYGGFLGIVATGFLNRQSVISPDGATRFVLWPRESASGMSEAFTAQLIYTYGWSNEPEHGTSPLIRIREGVNQVFVWASEEILQDEGARARHESAIAEMNAALEGRVTYTLTATRPTSGLVFEARIEASCERNVRAYFQGNGNTRGEITGGEIAYCGLDVARASTVSHELGHSIGLQHTYAWEEMMSPFYSRYRIDEFSLREELAMRLLFERPAGNRFPDTDREPSAASASGYRIDCY